MWMPLSRKTHEPAVLKVCSAVPYGTNTQHYGLLVDASLHILLNFGFLDRHIAVQALFTILMSTYTTKIGWCVTLPGYHVVETPTLYQYILQGMKHTRRPLPPLQIN